MKPSLLSQRFLGKPCGSSQRPDAVGKHLDQGYLNSSHIILYLPMMTSSRQTISSISWLWTIALVSRIHRRSSPDPGPELTASMTAEFFQPYPAGGPHLALPLKAGAPLLAS